MALNDFFITLDGIRHLSASFIASLAKFFLRRENPPEVQSSLLEKEGKTSFSFDLIYREKYFHVCSFIEFFVKLFLKLFREFKSQLFEESQDLHDVLVSATLNFGDVVRLGAQVAEIFVEELLEVEAFFLAPRLDELW